MIGALIALALTAVLVVGWLRRRYLVVTVDGESMLPTYRPGERVLVRRTPPDSLHTGQVVVLSGFTRPGELPVPGPRWIIKRVAAVPGDPIPRETVPALRSAPGTRVPAGRLVVLGDNPDRSHDSRHAGYLTADRLFGVVLRKVEQRRVPGQ
ncbi:S26 family signal peptidase [Nonomuraea sediminis]|uniref:S26 family signal peptidase n=1 Tax=Nonomuraea sediminis TaxID=2835864 RepID=UPI001BDCA5AE|nr:S26 family signal peptidase [Nonomuraea sediminis]